LIRVVDIDGQRRQISIRRPQTESSQRNTNDDAHNFFFDAVYDWKYVVNQLSLFYLLIKINLVQNKKMFMNKQHDHLLIQYLKVLTEQYLLMVRLVLEKHLLWKVNMKQ